MSSGGYAVQKKGSAATGTVTSVGLTLPNIFNVTGSPVTTAGTLAATLATQVKNTIFAGPATGADAAPTFRLITAADIPDLSATYAALAADNTFTSTGYLAVPNGTTVQQPGSPANGMIRYNTTTGRFEFYNGGAWINYVKLTGDTMTGDLSVPNVNITTAIKLLDTTNKIALDVSASNTLRIANGFTIISKTSTLRGEDGTFTLPTYAFTSSTNSGMLWDNTNSALGFSTAGVVRGQFTALTGFAGNLCLTNAVPSLSNYSIGYDGTSTYVNGVTVHLRVANVTKVQVSSSALSIIDTVNLISGTTNGSKIGTATNQKWSIWNATPIVQPTTVITAATFVANTSGTVNDSATWDGYTIGQVVKALRNFGLLA